MQQQVADQEPYIPQNYDEPFHCCHQTKRETLVWLLYTRWEI